MHRQYFILRRQFWYQFADPGAIEGLVCLGGKSKPGGIGYATDGASSDYSQCALYPSESL